MSKLLLVGVVALALAACSNQVESDEAVANGEGTRIDLGLNSCGGTYEVKYTESEADVQVLVTDARSPISFGGNDCQDGVTLNLESPLADRPLIDLSRHLEIEVRFEPWNQQVYSEAEFSEALEAARDCVLRTDPAIDASIVETPAGPNLEVNIGDLPDGGSAVDPSYDCLQRHVEPLRH